MHEADESVECCADDDDKNVVSVKKLVYLQLLTVTSHVENSKNDERLYCFRSTSKMSTCPPTRGWPSKLYASLTCVTCQIRLFQVKPCARNYGDPPEDFDPSLPTLQGHSRSLEPARLHRPPTTSYLCSLVTLGPSRIVSEIKKTIFANFLHYLCT